MKAKIAIVALVLAVVAQASWKTDASIPNKPASGKLYGKPFTARVATLKNMGFNHAKQNGKVQDRAQAYILDLSSDAEFFPAQEFSIWFSTNPGEKLSGKTLVMKPYAFGTDEFRQQAYGNRSGTLVPRGITAIFTTTDKPSNSDSFSDNMSVRLTFGKQTGTTISGKVSLSLPDQSKSYLTGTFTATIKPQS